MNAFEAVSLIEGIEEGTEEQVVEAWQHLIDTGVVWTLQGAYGRAAERLIENGTCVAR